MPFWVVWLLVGAVASAIWLVAIRVDRGAWTRSDIPYYVLSFMVFTLGGFVSGIGAGIYALNVLDRRGNRP